LSLEDDLMRIFAGDRVKTLMDRMGMPDDEPIEHPWVTKSVENAQRKVEERNFDIRKNLLEYDDVMNAQRKTVYSLRQSLLLGRYEPEEIDETGKVTGDARKIPTDESIKEKVAPVIAQLVNMIAEEPLQTLDKNDVPRPPNRKELKKVKKLVEVESLQHEVYQMWGVKLELEGSAARKRTPLETYDELVELVAVGLSEQRERFLDLIDRVVSAIVEESCPPNRQPEDWDWKSIHQGFNEHFKEELAKDVDDMGEREALVCTIYERAEALYLQREEEIGVENMLRLLRHVYLEEIDRAWVDHLSNMEHLRDGIGLRGYGQRDPKNEYKKEGYNLFVNMMARVSSNVIARVFDAHIQRREQLEAMEKEAEARHQAELEAAVAKHLGEPAPEGSDETVTQAPTPPPQASAPKIGRNDPCPCGSGKKFKKCHGAALEDDDEDDDADAA
ncbi:MAG: SEC-C metal-binding domain-containing protein, partial [Polyangiaceae bacterium]